MRPASGRPYEPRAEVWSTEFGIRLDTREETAESLGFLELSAGGQASLRHF